MRRRSFMQTLAAGAAVGLPFYGRFASRARAGASDGPRRIICVTYPMGLAMQHWRPSAVGFDFTLPHITAPLEAFRDRCLFVSNVDNQLVQIRGDTSFGHQIKQESALTGTYTLSAFGGARRNTLEDVSMTSTIADLDQANGPSICQIAGDAIRTGAHVRRSVSLGVDGSPYNPRWATKQDRATSNFFFEAAGTPVEIVCNPSMAFNETFAGIMPDEGPDPAVVAARQRRQSVLDTVRSSFTELRSSLPAHDRAELERHASYIRQLEIDLGSRALCSAPMGIPTDRLSEGSWDRAPMTELAGYQVRTLAHAMACDLAPIGRLDFIGQQGPFFGVPTADALQDEWDLGNGALDGEPRWHGIVHTSTDGPGGRRTRPEDPFDPSGAFEIGLLDGYRFFVQQFANLLTELDRFEEGPDGRTVLENSLVVLASDMGDHPAHGPGKMGYILAGNLGAAHSGYHFDGSAPGRTGFHDPTLYNHNHVLNTIARIFDLRDGGGAPVEAIGLQGWDRGRGTLPVF